jgi:ABC-2 type transport system permease protein
MVGMLSMFWIFPLMPASTAFAPADSMPGWLRPFATYLPISVAADAVRGLSDGSASAGELALAIGWIAGLVAFFAPLSVRIYTRTD